MTKQSFLMNSVTDWLDTSSILSQVFVIRAYSFTFCRHVIDFIGSKEMRAVFCSMLIIMLVELMCLNAYVNLKT